jgi:uncharacterized membrane protein YqjE
LGSGSLLLARQRLELASLDIEEELLRIVALLTGALVTALLAALALAAAGAMVVVYFWDQARLAALGGVTFVFAIAACVAASLLMRAWRNKPRLLAATLAELDKDREQWSGTA